MTRMPILPSNAHQPLVDAAVEACTQLCHCPAPREGDVLTHAALHTWLKGGVLERDLQDPHIAAFGMTASQLRSVAGAVVIA